MCSVVEYLSCLGAQCPGFNSQVQKNKSFLSPSQLANIPECVTEIWIQLSAGSEEGSVFL